MPSVFLSHSSKDKPWVRQLAERLVADGVVVWLDEAELKIGDSLIEKIAAGIEGMDFVAAIISEHSVGSTWVQKELSLAMSKEIRGRKVTVLPLLIADCVLPESLRDKLYADFRSPERYEGEYTKLRKALGIAGPSKAAESATPPSHARVPPPPAASDEVRIVGVIKERIRQDSQFRGLHDVYFQLAPSPPAGWREQFMRAREFPRHSMWRKAWIEGDCIVIKCALDELERFHLRDLKQDVATANKELTLAEQRAAEEEVRRRQYLEEEAKKRDSVLDRLKFDE